MRLIESYKLLGNKPKVRPELGQIIIVSVSLLSSGGLRQSEDRRLGPGVRSGSDRMKPVGRRWTDLACVHIHILAAAYEMKVAWAKIILLKHIWAVISANLLN